ALSEEHLTTSKLKAVSFDLRRGEVLGIAGLVGAGRSDLGAALFGLNRVISGTIRIQGRLGLVPEDGRSEGLMMQMSVLENGTLAVLPAVSRAGFIQRRRERALLDPVAQRLALQYRGFDALVSRLSGGNQQKVLLA